MRKKIKDLNKEKGDFYKNEGNNTEARKYYSRSIKISKKIIYETLDLLEKIKVNFMIAPYESDAQIAYLCLNKIADLAITEDSDLICYGCQKVYLNNLIFKKLLI